MTFFECQELYWLLEELLDTDIHYILYAFPWSSIKKEDGTYELGVKGIWDVGIKNPKNKITTHEQYISNTEKIMNKYYGK